MSEFTRYDAELNIQYDRVASLALGGDYWRVMKPFKFYLSPCDIANEWVTYETNEWVYVPAGFLTDGASVPKLFQNIYGPWGNYGQAAVLHDYLCEYLSITRSGKPVGISRPQCDLIFKTAMLALGVERETAENIYGAVSIYRKIFDVTQPSQTIKKRRLESAWSN